MRIVFVLPSAGGGGGANSIVQESIGMARAGVKIGIAVNQGNFGGFISSYPEIAKNNVDVRGYKDPASLADIFSSFDIVCGTTAHSIKPIEQALSFIDGTSVKACAYYVQDYEPLFYRPNTPEWKEAYASYSRINGIRLFAKTDWICSVVQTNHGVTVTRVKASIDHEIYYPRLRLDERSDTIVVSAMVRPKTKRRAPMRTARILRWIARKYPEQVRIEVFGCPTEELLRDGIEIPAEAVNFGKLRRTDVPEILRRSNLFLDLSDYQAFGRTGLEAMASGCIPVLPILGGATEYAIDGVNSFLVDTRSDESIATAIDAYMSMPTATRQKMIFAGLKTASEFNVPRAVASEIAFFSSVVNQA